jgi:hypothetical protein
LFWQNKGLNPMGFPPKPDRVNTAIRHFKKPKSNLSQVNHQQYGNWIRADAFVYDTCYMLYLKAQNVSIFYFIYLDFVPSGTGFAEYWNGANIAGINPEWCSCNRILFRPFRACKSYSILFDGLHPSLRYFAHSGLRMIKNDKTMGCPLR